MIGELADSPAKRLAEYRERKQRYAFRSFRKDEYDYAVAEGWEHVKENKTSHRFRKLKPFDERFENELWCLLYTLGYPILNVGRKFSIDVAHHAGETVSKQIDVFAYDDETIIVAECKACEQRTKRYLQKDIAEFDSLKGPIAASLKRYFNGEFTQKLVWIVATRNVDWIDNDRIRAKSANIQILTESDLLYYNEIANRIGKSARYQFQAEFLARSKVKALHGVKVLALKSRLGPYNTYLFYTSAERLLPISYVNHRGLRDPDAAPTYQRLIQHDRLVKIAEYIKTGGFFPNSVIVNFKEPIVFEKVRSDEEGGTTGLLTLPDSYRSAWIIDGQHRLYGYAELDDDDKRSPLPVIAFESIPISEETKIFSDINSKQKTVAKKLLDEITGEIKLDSPDRREQLRAIAVRSLDLVRNDAAGPLFGKIAGAEISERDAGLTVPYLTDAILQTGILGRFVRQEGVESFLQGSLYWSDARDAVTRLATFLSEYFDLFRCANEGRWDQGKDGRFASNPGASGLIRFSGDLVSYMANKERDDPRTLHPKVLVERIQPYAEPVLSYFRNAPDDDLANRFATPFGAGGPAAFQFRLRELTHAAYPEFTPPGFEKDLREHSEERIADADRKVRTIQQHVQGYVLGKLQEIYGPEDYLERAVDNKEILKKTYEKYLDEDIADRKELGTYLDFLDLRKIVETPKNWDIFASALNIPLEDERKGKARYVGWFDEVNKIRRVPAHPFNRSYSDREVSILDQVVHALAQKGVVPT